MLVVVRDEGGSLAHAVAICRDAVSVERVLACSADDAVVRGRATTCAAEGRAWSGGSAVAEASVGADCTCRRSGLLGYALGTVVGIQREVGLAGDAITSAVRTLGTPKLAG